MQTRKSAVDFPAVADAKDKNQQAVVFDFADEAIIAGAVFPEFPEFGTVQCLTDAARVVQRSQALPQKLQDALSLLRVELAQFAVGLGGQLNLPGHAASRHLRVEWSVPHRSGCVRACVLQRTGLPDHRGARRWLRERRNSWCARCGGPVFQGVSQWIPEDG